MGTLAGETKEATVGDMSEVRQSRSGWVAKMVQGAARVRRADRTKGEMCEGLLPRSRVRRGRVCGREGRQLRCGARRLLLQDFPRQREGGASPKPRIQYSRTSATPSRSPAVISAEYLQRFTRHPWHGWRTRFAPRSFKVSWLSRSISCQ